jgi:hypothetical protein
MVQARVSERRCPGRDRSIRRAPGAALWAMLILALAGSCGAPPQEEASPSETKSGAPEAAKPDRPEAETLPVAEEAKAPEGQDEAGDIFALMDLEKELAASPEAPSPQALERLEAQRKALVANLEPKKISEDVDLMAFKFERTEGAKDPYRISLLFRANKKLEIDYRIYVVGYVDKLHVRLLPDSRQEHRCMEWWWNSPNPPTSAWQPGQLILLRQGVQAQPIPYDIVVGIKDHGAARDGWVADLGD